MTHNNDTELKKLIEAYINDHTDEMIADIIKLCSVDSENSAPEPGMPYGRGAYEALCTARSICDSYGFKTREYDAHVVTADTDTGEACLDILAHMDVVAPGDGWSVTEPYAPVVKDGRIYGRGTSDDKGPAMAALYAMRALKELAVPLSRNCRLILGSDEEIASRDIAHYYSIEAEAPMTFSPDAEFPLINVEKGQFRGSITGREGFHAEKNAVPVNETAADVKSSGRLNSIACNDGNAAVEKHENAAAETAGIKAAGNAAAVKLVYAESGHTINIVPHRAYAILKGAKTEELEAVLKELKAELGADFGWNISEDETHESALRLSIEGKAAHASTPELGVNALVILLQLLNRLDISDSRLAGDIAAAASLLPFGDHRGETIGAACSDDISGSTSLSPNIMRIDDNGIFIKFDARTCIEAENVNSVQSTKEHVKAAGLKFEYTFLPAHAVDPDSDFIRTLLGCYEEVTGIEGRCLTMGGGTYVHELKNGVAFGAIAEDTDTHMHGADEFMPIDQLQTAAVIYALAIARLCR